MTGRQTDGIRVELHSTFELLVKDATDLSRLTLTVRVQNAFNCARDSLQLTLRDETPDQARKRRGNPGLLRQAAASICGDSQRMWRNW